MPKHRHLSARCAIVCVLLVAASGCESSPSPAPELVAPDLAAANAALVAALDAWKAGKLTSGVLVGSNPAVGVVDATRGDRRLLGYEVVGPLLVVDKARPFAVRLDIDAPRETVTARYLVLGRDPLWVFRQEDFDRMLHWEHRMSPEPAPQPPTAP